MSPLFEDSANDPPLPGRRAAMDDDARHTRDHADPEPEREVTLNTGVVLALFFALALLCAVFFGFGYSMGRKSVPTIPVADTNPSSSTEDVAVTTSKPSPGSPEAAAVPSYVGPAGTPAVGTPKPAPVKTTPVPAEAAAAATEAPPRVRVVETPPAQTPAPVVRTAPASANSSASTSAAAASGTVYVQVSAVSHQEDANVLLSALRRRGYTVVTRSDPNDSLIHVQLGPFTTRKDADAMRQRLSGDGYNAILK